MKKKLIGASVSNLILVLLKSNACKMLSSVNMK